MHLRVAESFPDELLAQGQLGQRDCKVQRRGQQDLGVGKDENAGRLLTFPVGQRRGSLRLDAPRL